MQRSACICLLLIFVNDLTGCKAKKWGWCLVISSGSSSLEPAQNGEMVICHSFTHSRRVCIGVLSMGYMPAKEHFVLTSILSNEQDGMTRWHAILWLMDTQFCSQQHPGKDTSPLPEIHQVLSDHPGFKVDATIETAIFVKLQAWKTCE